MINITIERKHVYLIAIIAMVAAFLIPAGAYATSQFNDVPNTNGFHNDIDWVKTAGVTLGCGDGTNYCPRDNVTREQMAAFMKRLATNQVVDAKTNSGLSITAAGTFDSSGTIRSGTGNFTVTSPSVGRYVVDIGTNYIFTKYVTTATAVGTAKIVTTNSVSGDLLIDVVTPAGTSVGGIVSFVIYDPTP